VLLDELFRLPMMEVATVGVAEMDAAYAAFVLYGRGSGHRAALNFGDVFSYALAKVRGLPLLFKGEDFAGTGIRIALRPAAVRARRVRRRRWPNRLQTRTIISP
jgi:ribonuclease VapC